MNKVIAVGERQDKKVALLIQHKSGQGSQIVPVRYTDEDVQGIISGSSKWVMFEDTMGNKIHVDKETIATWMLVEVQEKQQRKVAPVVMQPEFGPRGRKTN